MSYDTEKDGYYRDAFNIALKKEDDLTEWETNIFLKVMEFLGVEITDLIEDFNASNKGILLIGGNYEMLCGVTSYIWYTHPLQHFASGNDCVKDSWERCHLLHKDFFGFNNEEEIRASLFSQPNGLMNGCKYGKTLFLRDINTKYIEILEQIGRTIQNFELFYREGSKSVWYEYLPSIVIMNAKQTDGVPENFLNQFQIINLGPTNQKSKVISQKDYTEKRNTKGLGKGKKSRIPKEPFIKTIKRVVMYCEKENIKKDKKEKWTYRQMAVRARQELENEFKGRYGKIIKVRSIQNIITDIIKGRI